MTDVSGSVLQRELGDRYTIERELGRGGMGVVYLARDLKLDRPVALKVLPGEFSADPALKERFLRETRTAASFSHPNIVPVYAVEEREHLIAYAMGFVEGESLTQKVQRSGPLTVREIVRLLQDIGYALAYAHGRGVVHRDIKPDNIMIERATGRALLMDFGISRVMEGRSAARGLTRVGEVVGTPEYMSPEQAAGDVVDGRSDIYSLGLVAWFAVTGRTAMTGESTQKILVKQLTEPVMPVESVRPELPDLLSAAIDACVAKAPEDRFATAEALVEAVDHSQLAGPEIPLPVRIFTQELGTMSLIVLFVALFSWYVGRALLARMSALDAFLPVVILFSVALTRVLQTLNEGRRLFEAGYYARCDSRRHARHDGRAGGTACGAPQRRVDETQAAEDAVGRGGDDAWRRWADLAGAPDARGTRTGAVRIRAGGDRDDHLGDDDDRDQPRAFHP